MCNCSKDVKIQEYTNQTCYKYPFYPETSENEYVCLDNCIAEEVISLWSMGIQTTGCCCGHNVTMPFIGVMDEYIPKMKKLGYVVQLNFLGLDREDSFYPKSIEIKPEMV